jgi:methylated-DNA-protein-cysteine methyltransferase related protein
MGVTRKKGSPHFARIKREVLEIVAAIPPGRVATYKDIGDSLDVMPRHVAYILATLDPVDRAHIPWQRVISDKASSPHPRIAVSELSKIDK